jgi:hypothetical protein
MKGGQCTGITYKIKIKAEKNSVFCGVSYECKGAYSKKISIIV